MVVIVPPAISLISVTNWLCDPRQISGNAGLAKEHVPRVVYRHLVLVYLTAF